jgi:hypothetical protein
MTQQRPGMFQPALICGLAAGVLTALPFVNCLCCLWVIGGAILAAYLFSKRSPAPPTPGDGAVIGIMTGIVAAVADSIVSLPFETLNREFVQRFLDQFSQFVQEMPQGWEKWIERRAAGMSPAWFLLGLLASAVIYAALGALGGIIGSSIFARPKTPPAPGSPIEKPPDAGSRQP